MNVRVNGINILTNNSLCNNINISHYGAIAHSSENVCVGGAKVGGAKRGAESPSRASGSAPLEKCIRIGSRIFRKGYTCQESAGQSPHKLMQTVKVLVEI